MLHALFLQVEVAGRVLHLAETPAERDSEGRAAVAVAHLGAVHDHLDALRIEHCQWERLHLEPPLEGRHAVEHAGRECMSGDAFLDHDDVVARGGSRVLRRVAGEHRHDRLGERPVGRHGVAADVDEPRDALHGVGVEVALAVDEQDLVGVEPHRLEFLSAQERVLDGQMVEHALHLVPCARDDEDARLLQDLDALVARQGAPRVALVLLALGLLLRVRATAALPDADRGAVLAPPREPDRGLAAETLHREDLQVGPADAADDGIAVVESLREERDGRRGAQAAETLVGRRAQLPVLVREQRLEARQVFGDAERADRRGGRRGDAPRAVLEERHERVETHGVECVVELDDELQPHAYVLVLAQPLAERGELRSWEDARQRRHGLDADVRTGVREGREQDLLRLRAAEDAERSHDFAADALLLVGQQCLEFGTGAHGAGVGDETRESPHLGTLRIGRECRHEHSRGLLVAGGGESAADALDHVLVVVGEREHLGDQHPARDRGVRHRQPLDGAGVLEKAAVVLARGEDRLQPLDRGTLRVRVADEAAERPCCGAREVGVPVLGVAHETRDVLLRDEGRGRDDRARLGGLVARPLGLGEKQIAGVAAGHGAERTSGGLAHPLDLALDGRLRQRVARAVVAAAPEHLGGADLHAPVVVAQHVDEHGLDLLADAEFLEDLDSV